MRSSGRCPARCARWTSRPAAVALYVQGETAELALLPQRRVVATLGRGEVDDLLVSGRRAAVYQR
jgi:hypothetical protein